jgi:hypothetical protein
LRRENILAIAIVLQEKSLLVDLGATIGATFSPKIDPGRTDSKQRDIKAFNACQTDSIK